MTKVHDINADPYEGADVPEYYDPPPEAEPEISAYARLQNAAQSGATLLATPPVPREWLIPGWIPAGRVAMLTGTGGAGKSRLALQLALAAAGWADGCWIANEYKTDALMPTAPPPYGPACYLGWEDEPDEVARRMAWHGVTADSPAAAAFTSIDMAQLGPLWGGDYGADWTPIGLAVLGRLHEARLLVIDPIAAAYAGNENDRGEVRGFMSELGGRASETGCAVLIVAHPPKTAAAYSGSTDWQGSVRSLMVLEKMDGDGADGEKVDVLRHEKSNYSARADALQLTLAPRVGGADGGLSWQATGKHDNPVGPARKSGAGKAGGRKSGAGKAAAADVLDSLDLTGGRAK